MELGPRTTALIPQETQQKVRPASVYLFFADLHSYSFKIPGIRKPPGVRGVEQEVLLELIYARCITLTGLDHTPCLVPGCYLPSCDYACTLSPRDVLHGVSALAWRHCTDSDNFVQETSFVGARRGYVFKTGAKGLGYYADDSPVVTGSAGAVGGTEVTTAEVTTSKMVLLLTLVVMAVAVWAKVLL